ncbi:MAG: cation:proton antiporter [Candidatus Methanospirareceae archaeon]
MMNLVLAIGIMIFLGFLAGLIFERFKFPMITGYIVLGMVLSPSLLGVIPAGTVEQLDIITDVALGLIAYLIGSSIRWEQLQQLAKPVAWITLSESSGAWIFVTVVLAALGPMLVPGEPFWETIFPMAVLIGAVSAATAPAATMAIVSELRAKGPFTTTLLAVVGLDDAIAIIIFAVATGLSRQLVKEAGVFSVYLLLGVPALQIAGAALLGITFALVLFYLVKLVRAREFLVVVIVGTILLCTGIAGYLGVSSILANLILGFFIINLAKREELKLTVEEFENLIFVLFFVIAGLHFDLSVLKVAGVLALLIVVARWSGKNLGVRLGATISHASGTVKNYLGLALLPKAGVTIGLILLAAREFPSFGVIMLNAVLASTIINELIAPPLTKYALLKTGEAQVVT